jgi:hypothetical protein
MRLQLDGRVATNIKYFIYIWFKIMIIAYIVTENPEALTHFAVQRFA